jgi:hypothetical protein
MGSWGIKALESDNGLDVIDCLEEFISGNNEFKLPEIINFLKSNGLLGEDFTEIDFLYDNTAMAVAELYLMFKDTGKLDYTNDDETRSLEKNIKSFPADKESLEYILQYLMDIKNEVPDADGEREIVELYNEEIWQNHLDELIKRINEECDLMI